MCPLCPDSIMKSTINLYQLIFHHSLNKKESRGLPLDSFFYLHGVRCRIPTEFSGILKVNVFEAVPRSMVCGTTASR